MVRRVTVTREHVLAYRGNVHDLMRPGSGAAVLDVGLQDHPPGRTALPALRLRTGNTAAGEGTALVHGVRGAMHLHRTADLALLSAALRHRDPRELAPATLGPFGAELSRAGVGLGDAMDEVAAAMTEAMSDGVARAKGELSGAVSDRVERRLTPWCEGCGTHHVQDALFRYATLQAGLVVEVASPRLLRYRRAVTPGARPDPEELRRSCCDASSARWARLRPRTSPPGWGPHRLLHGAGGGTPPPTSCGCRSTGRPGRCTVTTSTR